MRGGGIAQKLERQVHVVGRHPADKIIPCDLAQAGGLVLDRFLNGRGQVNSDESANETIPGL